MKKLCLLSFLIACTLTMQAQFRGGSGTTEDPYLVADGYDLADIANYRTSHFKQIADIDLSEWIADNAPQLGWMPIGTEDAPFEGSYDGGNFTIRGLVINRPTMKYVGLFGYASKSNTIQNVVVEAPDVIGGISTGVIAGYSYCTIKNCQIISAKIKGGGEGGCNVGGIVGGCSNPISNCKADITSLISSGYNVGGVCGYCKNTIENCEVNAISISSSSYNVGGIVGYLSEEKNIKNCQVTAVSITGTSYVGGIVGLSYALISNSVAIIDQIKGSDRVGGIVGNAQNTIESCYSFANISSNEYAGGICGYSSIYQKVSKYSSYPDYPSAVNKSVSNCSFDGSLNSRKAGGIMGLNAGQYLNSWSSGSYYYKSRLEGARIRSCLVRNASIKTKEYAGGIQGKDSVASADYNVENCVSLASVVSSQNTDNAYRIVGNTYGKNNKAFNQTELYQSNKKVMTIADNAQNGVAYGEKTLMRSSSYTGLGWDFNTVWTIQEGESYPYLQIQSDYPVVTDITSINKAILKGTCKSNGKLTIINNGAFVTTPILDNKWEANLGAVNHGDTLYVYAQAEGKMPSVVVRYVFNESSVNPDPQGIVGDANGDGVIDSADVTAIINFILGKPSASFNRTNADVNGDGEILIDDAVQTVQLIMDAQ